MFFLISLFTSIYALNKVTELSFNAPFRQFDPVGKREISNYHIGGDATLQENFLRLTPDRQSKNGHIYSDKAFHGKLFTAALKFRVSGKGKLLFGDGFTVIFNKEGMFNAGNYFGQSGRFKGVAVTFDTFRNSETSSFHKDIGIVVNDGDSIVKDDEKEIPGCDDSFRWSEGRDDFNINNHAEARFSFNSATKLFKVVIDSAGTGNFRTCAETTLPFDDAWSDLLYMSISAATGELADNHDILSFNLYTDTDNTDEISDVDRQKKQSVKNEKEQEFEKEVVKAGGDAAQLNPVEKTLHNKIDELELSTESKLNDLEHHLEHQLTAVNDELKITISKLQKQSDISEARIVELEAKLKQILEEKVNSELKQRLQVVEKALEEQIGVAIHKSTGTWHWPFFLLFVALIALGVLFYKKYKYIMKTHLL